MHRLSVIVSLLALAWVSGVRAEPAVIPDASNAVVIASWNVENLFDADDDPANPGDDDFTPSGWTRWTPARYARKLEHLADVIAAMRPDILCLAEIENRRVLEDLSRVLREQHRYDLPVIVHREGHDKRGIDVGMLARWAPAATNWLSPHPFQRDVLAARFDIRGRPITLLMNHWKSWAGPAAENIAIRTQEAAVVRAEVLRLLAADPSAAVLATGDFNDNVTSDTLVSTAGFVPVGPYATNAATAARVLNNLAGYLPADQRGTYYYSKDRVWNSFDSISVSAGMLHDAARPAPWQVRAGSYAVFFLPRQRDESGHPLPFRRVRSKATGDVYVEGYADHFPVCVTLQPARTVAGP